MLSCNNPTGQSHCCLIQSQKISSKVIELSNTDSGDILSYDTHTYTLEYLYTVILNQCTSLMYQ